MGERLFNGKETNMENVLEILERFQWRLKSGRQKNICCLLVEQNYYGADEDLYLLTVEIRKGYANAGIEDCVQILERGAWYWKEVYRPKPREQTRRINVEAWKQQKRQRAAV